MRNIKVVVATIFSTMGLGLAVMPAAHAASLIPQQEGEVKLTNVSCVASTCIDVEKDMGFKVTSLGYDFDSKGPQYGLSRLFVDKSATANDWGFGIKFGQQDAGTNTASNQFWYRPVAYQAATANSAPTGNSTPAEGSQLEIGRFKFELGNIFSEVKIDFFDVEDGGTGILEVNGTPVQQLLAAGPDSNIQSLTLKNVSSFVVQMGKPGPDSIFKQTGDGVRLSGLTVGATVPEPGTVMSLGALAVVGVFGLRRGKKFISAG
ncbi:LEVG family PEP-CTERM protein [Iningainema tapete]|uniref:LEVG family PEP-CTERM protein n=1 Tax=Iningainema tapete BLCC-T55 TaxID=2748662 RepID=A0A8J7BX11_9CYAN|nr:LEVG family PEP-CTERM protein [Iningainema tapete]MBD2772802.1 LEVG family PEP-CTERM protein [Iningainema tapete BLCC-T55]